MSEKIRTVEELLALYEPVARTMLPLTPEQYSRVDELIMKYAPVKAPSRIAVDKSDEVTWVSASELLVEGRGWSELRDSYTRLPARLQEKVPKMVWLKSQASAGLSVKFRTDATSISVRWTLTSDVFQMHHMASTGCSGCDLYVRDQFNQWRFLQCHGTGRNPTTTPSAEFVKDLTAHSRDYILNLSLYNTVSSVEIGVKGASYIEGATPSPKKPIVVYGTSITQGACASRPGQAYTSVLSRRLNWPVVNLGFSGNGKAEVELAEVIAEIDASVYVVDCVANITTADEIAERYPVFVKALRLARPLTPIVLVESGGFARGVLPCTSEDQFSRKARLLKNQRVRESLEAVRKAGICDVHLVSAEGMYRGDNEDTVDGLHPNDLGMLGIAQKIEPTLRSILKKSI